MNRILFRYRTPVVSLAATCCCGLLLACSKGEPSDSLGNPSSEPSTPEPVGPNASTTQPTPNTNGSGSEGGAGPESPADGGNAGQLGSAGNGGERGGEAGGSSEGGSGNEGGRSNEGGAGAGDPMSGGSAGTATAGSGGEAPMTGGAGGSDPSPFGIGSRVTPQTCLRPATRDGAAALLSESGCVDPNDPTKPAAAVIPYTVSSPLWSDGALKTRFLALPDDATIQVKDCSANPGQCDPEDPSYTSLDDGDWIVPDGTVLIKNFALGSRLVETRLLVKLDEFNWWGYSYEWREDQTEADLLAANADGYEREITTDSGVQTWHYPSRTQCLQCHTESSGRSLGPETSQLNLDFAYPSGVTSNQMETLMHLGVFEGDPALLSAYPDPTDESIALELRARSYLHANCANCHRPGGESTDFDLRFSTPLADTATCDVAPTKGDFGLADARIIAPGSPETSVLSLRMHELDTEVRMPRIGTRIVDDVGVGVVDEWIASLTGCE